jgi:hypothetical protein
MTSKGYVIGVVPEPSSGVLLAVAAIRFVFWARGRAARNRRNPASCIV